ncbi:hypothetical protein BD626DRAFT_580263 [Schizophyllum amplum]|uniref:NACHT domain-containing protein n=1 Tax=Schizophyllum amplum TaxID=97359 RepID=A0A550CYZ0_9AGAR|nr:hypothetical protein BD626DRAFT_580263 [Auriculariopsis ampla]
MARPPTSTSRRRVIPRMKKWLPALLHRWRSRWRSVRAQPPSPPDPPLEQFQSSAHHDNFTILWQEALTSYKTDTGIDLCAQEGVVIDSNAAVLEYLNKHEAQFKNFRQDGLERIRERVMPVTTVMEGLCAVVGDTVAAVFAPGKMIFSAIGMLLKASIAVHDDFEMVCAAFDTMRVHMRIIQIDAAEDTHSIIRDASIALLVQILTILGIMFKLRKNGRMRHYLSKFGRSDEVSSALDKLGKLASSHHHAASVVTLDTTKDILKTLNASLSQDGEVVDAIQKYQLDLLEIEKDIIGKFGPLREQLGEVQYMLRTTDLEKIFDWLHYPDSSAKKNSLLEDRNASTGSWFLMGTEFAGFKAGTEKAIWLQGNVGCGKSTMIAAAMEELRASSTFGKTEQVVSHMFDVTNVKHRRDLRALISSILCQLASRNAQCLDALLTLRTKHSVGCAEAAVEELDIHLNQMLRTIQRSRIFIVIDALDEADCQDIIPFLGRLRHLMKVSLLVSSRKDVSFRNALEEICDTQVVMDEALVARDIKIALDHYLGPGGVLKAAMENKEVENGITELKTKAHDNFRYIMLHLKEVQDWANFPAFVLKRLKNLPTDLVDMYKLRLNLIDEKIRADVRRLLIWVVLSHRPLSVADFAQLTAFIYDDQQDFWECIPEFKASLAPQKKEEIMRLIDNTFLSQRDGEVRIAHASVKEFLLRLEGSSDFHIDKSRAYRLMARAGLAYIDAIPTSATDCSSSQDSHRHHLTWTWVVYASRVKADDHYPALEKDVVRVVSSSRKKKDCSKTWTSAVLWSLTIRISPTVRPLFTGQFPPVTSAPLVYSSSGKPT